MKVQFTPPEMNLILSAKASQKLKKQGCSLVNFVPNISTWRVDCLVLVKRSIFIIANEKTLYTYVSSYKSGLNGIIQKITSIDQDSFNVDEIQYVKFQNRSVIGSISNIKNIISHLDKYYPSDNERYEELVNQTPFKYLSQRCPAEVHLSYKSIYIS